MTFLLLHIVVAQGSAWLFCKAPDWIQKLILLHIIAVSLALVGFYWALLVKLSPPEAIRQAALELEHIGVLLYVFRLGYRERICKRRLEPSPHYQD